ncbi:XXYS1_4_G0033160.mRNA.1.CDS.1 [Saccharomyces cerevisiae]|nr:XXYS1_4_G0033160.mRNA.1.CDS.1 [Saccharomyces cerevisiae]
MESIFLHTNITIISHSVSYVSLSYYIINPCISASTILDDCFAIFMSSSYTVYDNILIDIEVFSDSVSGTTPAPGYSSTWVYTSGNPIGTENFICVSWAFYPEFSQCKSLLATVAQSDGISSPSSAGSSSEMNTKKKGYKYRRLFSFSLLPFLSFFLL